MSNGIEFDSEEVKLMFARLTQKGRNRTFTTALRKAGQILQKETEKKYKAETGLGNIKVKVTKKGKERTKTKRIATVVVSKDLEAKVHIMANYKTKWLEMGTKPRMTKGHKHIGYYTVRDGGRKFKARSGKSAYRGRIGPKLLFRDAKIATEKRVFQSISDQVNAEIVRMAKKNGAWFKKNWTDDYDLSKYM